VNVAQLDDAPLHLDPERERFDEDLRRAQRFYTETFLPTNAWTPLAPHPYLCLRQKQRRVREALVESGLGGAERVRRLDVLDVGSGDGGTLAWLVELGADPARLLGVDLVEARVERARARFANLRFEAGDFTKTDVGGPFDVVLLVAVLSSVLDEQLRARIVARCLELVRPGGVFFFYDVIAPKPLRAAANWRALTFDEMSRYLGGRPVRWWKRDYLRRDVADRVVPRLGVVAAEALQAIGVCNMEAAFGYVRIG
jgi:SAM-dependent methyltransferase